MSKAGKAGLSHLALQLSTTVLTAIRRGKDFWGPVQYGDNPLPNYQDLLPHNLERQERTGEKERRRFCIASELFPRGATLPIMPLWRYMEKYY